MNVKGKHYRTIWEKENDPAVIQIINQQLLPHRFEVMDLISVEDFRRAIKEMFVRGAGLIGATAGYGMYMAVLTSPRDDWMGFVRESADILTATRPTASNLAWAVKRQLAVIEKSVSREDAISISLNEARAIADEDADFCRRLGDYGLKIIEEISRKKKGETVHILTHCNAGWLAFVDYGSATAPIYAAHEAGIKLHVWVDETRPRNQGASLTAWELSEHGVAHDLIPDNAGGHLMQHGMADLVIVGTDRVARNGDVANKIGTYLKALAAYDNGVPFYVALPSSTFDFAVQDGVRDIPIEERDGAEVRTMTGKTARGNLETVQICPDATPARNWGFDVTPARLITGLICERGVCEASEKGILGLFPEEDEGYVKYSATRREDTLPNFPWFDKLNETRTALHRLGLIGIYDNGIGFGNISHRYEGESFVISGTATGGDETLSKDQYALVESFDLNHNSVQVLGRIDASSESMSHGAVYKASPGTQSVIHIHSRKLFDFMMAGAYPRTPAQAAYGTPEMAWAVKSVVKAGAAPSGLFVMAGHDEGIIAYGESLEKASELILSLNQQI